MALIEIVREVRLTPADAWARLTDWDRHGDFVPLTSIVQTPTGFDAFTGVGPIGFHDPMDVVQWDEPSFCRLEKRGRVVTGWAELRVDPAPAGSRVSWREDIHVRGTPSLLDGLTRASSRALFSRVIDGLLAPAP
ncbi:SRPBCC family protein [Aeromicrobium wangtongii]|uniref:SRPBCC family protein n=1 Tax=Aeromicrobium wangtongii TaxID=2969247 RepID=A0ABY5M1I7_9ACTN|nr:SRPBCC family protein [Aeromicrobium wangtongii]MCD9198023.1 SRPBCC family protein [Aeromicrobium wangtongii]UUP12065.1 SRPBCC family protein [Aeromicrobium wangtongii]